MITDFGRYQSYQDSGFEWFEDIPAHWKMTHLKRVAKKITDGEHISPEFTDEGMPFLSAKDVRDRKIILTVNKYVNFADGKRFRKRCNPLRGDLLMVSRGATIGRIGLVETDQEFCLLGSVILIKPNHSKIDNLYLFYFFNISVTQKNLFLASQASAQQAIYLADVSGLPTLLPPVSEQKAIAQYLDTKTAQINRKIDLLTQKATLYSNLKQSLINETVTRGLDKSVPMEDRGIEWLGEVPEHWEIKRLKDIATITRGAILRPVDEPSYFDINGEWYYLNISDVTKCDKFLYSAQLRLSDLGSRKSARVLPNSIVLTASATIGKPTINKVKVCVHDGFIPFQKIKCDTFYLYYLLINKSIYTSMGKSNTQKNIYLDEVKNVGIAVPPLSEQKAIADYLDTKTAQIDQIIQTINTQIEKLNELRKTLINDVVTGKIKVV